MKIQDEDKSRRLVLVTGVTGYVGGRLVPKLLESGFPVRVLVRGGPERLRGRDWAEKVDIKSGDVLDRESLSPAMSEVEVAYYLIHSMRDSSEFRKRDILAAENFASAAASAGVKRIIYLGGLGDPEGELSEHLQSRHETGAVLGQHGVPVTEFKAGIVVGSGSLSFEMVRHLTERLPVMICPKWVFTRTHPIAIGDVLDYLVATIDVPESLGQVIEIGGADVLSYAEMMHAYARERRLKRIIIPVPVLTPRLSSYWAHWVTPIPATIARPLINGLRYELVARDDKARQLFPGIRPIDYQSAVKLALSRIEKGEMESIWSDALISSQGDQPPLRLTQEQGMIIERRHTQVDVPPELLFSVYTGIGGDRGWPSHTWLWRLREAIDRIMGGVGMRRGRRHPDELREGDALDSWRVEAVDPGRRLRLRSEMKLPGKAWLQFESKPVQDSCAEFTQVSYFAPRGLLGLVYWYTLYPFHRLVFSGTHKGVISEAESRQVSGVDKDNSLDRQQVP